MNSEQYIDYFPQHMDDIIAIANPILKDKNEKDFYKHFNDHMKAKAIELNDIILNKRDAGIEGFGMFLTDLLNELYAAKNYQESYRDLFSSDKKLSTVLLVLVNFNNKFLSGLSNRYGREYPSHFENHTTYNSSPAEFKLDAKIEKTETFRYSYLIAKGIVSYDTYNFYYNNKTFTTANTLSNEIGINRNYLTDTKNQVQNHNNKNIFSPNRKKTQDYLVSKMKSEGDTPVEFYNEKYNKIGCT